MYIDKMVDIRTAGAEGLLSFGMNTHKTCFGVDGNINRLAHDCYCSSTTYCTSLKACSLPMALSSGYYIPDCVGGAPIGLAVYIRAAHGVLSQLELR